MSQYPSLQGRVVIITGGGGGFGRVMATALLQQGARLMLVGARSPDALKAMVDEGEVIAPGACRGMIADITDYAACERVVATTAEAFGRVDVLINNAARPGFEAAPVPGKPFAFWEADVEGYRRLVDTNLLGAFHMARAVGPGMVARGFGKIINISTSRVTMTLKTGTPYGALKAGLEALSVSWAKDAAEAGLTVNVLLPGGASDTGLIFGEVGKRAAPDFQAGKGPPGMEGNVAGGLLPPQIMAPPALWLCADESNAVNGRRVVARDWDPDLPAAEAAERAMQPVHAPPLVM
jgi:NAD(P)-dependent dehydrogenase (short-subunit alcohol dehydrogenase family)